VEIAIPLNQLRFNSRLPETTWGLNLCRVIVRKNEDAYWVRFRASYSFSPDLFVKSFIQYNDERRSASFNFLFWYVYRPGSDLYVVYNEGWETGVPGPREIQPRTRSLAVKMTFWLSR
jgi:hypothetical protein